jgi:adenine-specific DNA-methyltransferase
VAITPRSFCNGPYFKPFRVDFLKLMSLRRLHVFDSRAAAFSRDEVLQENVIVHAVKNAVKPRHVVVSSSSGEPGASIGERRVAYSDVVSPDDPEQFIHLSLDERQNKAKSDMGRLTFTLADLGLTVSTGRVVDFRAAPYLRSEPAADTAPLIYPCHFNGGVVHWPKMNSRKPNAIVSNELTRDLLVPAGVYVLVKRFTSKEERRRVVACLYDPAHIPAPLVGFENHLNYFYVAGQGLPLLLAKGLAVFLNSSVVDTYFRQFSGHTQVNATDLRSLRYPCKDDLLCLGREMGDSMLEQEKLDALIEGTLF